MDIPADENIGIRERKRLRTRRQIAEAGQKLFLSNGFEDTTLDAIAVAADVSRRTLFNHFDSKEDILLALLGDGPDLLRKAIAEVKGDTPIEVASNAIYSLASTYESYEFATIDELLHSSVNLRAGNRTHYEIQERVCFEALLERFQGKVSREVLKLTAMIAIGTVRISLELWRNDGRPPGVKDYLHRSFETTTNEVFSNP